MRRTAYAIIALVMAAASIAAAPGNARADGFIVIVPPPEPPPSIVVRPIPPPPRPAFFPLAVRYHRVTVSIEEQVATTDVDQVFTNPNPGDLEGTYIFPLPEDAAVSKFSLYMGGKEVEAELLDRDRAREIYESIVRRMRDPALLEYVGRGAFRARIYPIPGRGEARIKLRYQQLLRADGGLCEYRYPLDTEKFSSRPLEEARVEVVLRSSAPIGSVFSPSHPLEVVREAGGSVRVGWSQKDSLPDRDFVLYFQKSEKGRQVGATLVTHKPAGEDGYFLLLLAPTAESGAAEAPPKDVVFVLDTSGSMAGEKLEQARGALRYCLKSLGPSDRFALIDFATDVRAMTDGLVAASRENLQAAHAYVDGMKARGGTDICGALLRALAFQGFEKGRPFMVVFLTDGEPTIGVTKPDEIEKAVLEARLGRPDKEDVRLFVFGVGSDLNVALLDRLVESNRGARDYVGPRESIEVKVSRFFDKVSSPVFSGVTAEFSGIETYDLYPRPIPDLFRGGEVGLVGRYRGEGARAIRLKGKLGGHEAEILFEVRFGGTASAPFLPRVFAVRKVAYLLEQIRLHGESAELKQEIVRLAREYGIVTPYTSYLVVEDQRLAGAPAGGAGRAASSAIEELRRRIHWYRDAEDAAKGALEGDFRARATGDRAVAASEAIKRLAEPAAPEPGKPGAELGGAVDAMSRFGAGTGGAGAPVFAPRAEAAERALTELVREIEGRTFYRDGEVWVDSRLKPEMEVERIVYLSERYFEVVRERAEIARLLAVGPRVRLALSSTRAIEVVPD